MHKVINKYLGKLEVQGLAKKEDAIMLALDAGVFSNRPLTGDSLILNQVFDLMNISSLLFAEPAEPYRSIIREIINYDCECGDTGCIVPMDCETRTFFHDIPVIEEFSASAIANALSRRKSAIIKGRGIVTYGAVTPEQAFVSFSSACFSAFVKYFYDSMACFERHANAARAAAFREIVKKADIEAPAKKWTALESAKPKDREDVIRMVSEAGRAVVKQHLVDSYFGNISYIFGDHIFISQTGSSLDELGGCIDMVPLDGSSSVGITASSELSAHRHIYEQTGDNAILHGHPKFSVIMSMYCQKSGCDRSLCHKACPEKRYIVKTPIVPGEIGTGPTGLMKTVPAAMKEGKGAIVYGHGVFTAGKDTYRGPFDMLAEIEEKCRAVYFRTVNDLLKQFPDSGRNRFSKGI
jgi:ribulose-5-phosphate 4-epimerase/fuculose-1-phosphate aldolase